MKIALVDLCRSSDFSKHRTYAESMAFLVEEGIDFIDYASGLEGIEAKVNAFHKALDSDADLLWVIRGGNECLNALNTIDWNKVKCSGKIFFGLSDFTHFSMVATAKGLTCLYGQGLAYIKEFFPTKNDRAFITNLLKTGAVRCDRADAFLENSPSIDLKGAKILGGYLPAVVKMMPSLRLDLTDINLFIEYHSDDSKENIREFRHDMRNLIRMIEQNKPKSIIMGHLELTDENEKTISMVDAKKIFLDVLAAQDIPLYCIDHFKNTITFKI